MLSTAIALALLLVPVPGWVVEELYSRDTYPWLQDILTAGTNVVPFAVLDVLLLGGIVATVFRIVRLFNVARQRGIVDAIWEGLRRVIRFAAVLAVMFFWAWGFNYRRAPLEAGLPGAKAVEPTVDLLQLAVADANSLATRLRSLVITRKEPSYADLADALLPQMNEALKRLGRPALQRGGHPKYSFVLTPFFTSAGITGMINPFGLESIVHPELMPYERPFVLAHEWAHLSGQADEADASAVGWLACMQGEAHFAYSASLYLIMEASAKLPAEVRASVWARLDSGVRSDIDAVIARMRREDPRVQRATSRVYDEYLRANRVADGTASYSRALSLILTPPLREALSTYDPQR
jgi:hypothetical protein